MPSSLSGRRMLFNQYGNVLINNERALGQTGEDEEVGQILSWFKKPEARVLDLSPGPGPHARLLAERGCKVTRLDIFDPAISDKGRRISVYEMQKDLFIRLGIFDLVIGLGNTVSRFDRRLILPLFDRIRRVLSHGGVFVFSAFYWGPPSRKNFVEKGEDGKVRAVWEREFREEKGSIRLKGRLCEGDGQAAVHTFEAQCFKVPEMLSLLEYAGFSGVRWSNRLDFQGRALQGADTLFYRGSNAR